MGGDLTTAAATAARNVCASFHCRPPFRSADLYYSLWNYSLHSIRIGLRMQPRRSSIPAPRTAEDLFGQVLREVRKTRGLSQEELAFESGYHPTYIGQLERGKKSPSLRAIMRLAKALGAPGSELLHRLEVLEASEPASRAKKNSTPEGSSRD